jgi:hypothetical protein
MHKSKCISKDRIYFCIMTPLRQLKLRLLPVQISILVTFVLMPIWLKFEDAPKPFTATYNLGFVMIVPMLVSMAAWLLMGCPGWQNLFDWGRGLAIVALILLTVWSFYSQSWAFVAASEPGVGQNYTLQLAILTGFVIVLVCASPPPRVIIMVLLFSLVWSGIVAAWQVALQRGIGIEPEFGIILDPTQSGTSVIQAGAVRWLRPYGLLPHPNILGGVFACGMFAAAAWALSPHRLPRYIGLALFGAGFWLLMLSFSRSAWLGLGVGLLVALAFVLRQWRRWLPMTGLIVLLSVAFFVLYRPFLLARAGEGQPTTEMRSIADRIVYNQIAFDAISKHPVLGVGGGNYPWYASHYLHYNTDYDLRGAYVHNVALSLWAELGIVGLLLFVIFGIFGIYCVIREIRLNFTQIQGGEVDRLARIALLACFVALAVVGLVDHYPWSLIQGQIMWIGLFAVAMKPLYNNAPDTVSEKPKISDTSSASSLR